MVTNIFDIINGTAAVITFSLIPILIMSFTIVLKFILWALTEMAMRKTASVNFLRSFRDDHRNDSISNLFSFIGVLVASNYQQLALFDPCVSAIFLCYICFNWGKNCIDEMFVLAGKHISIEKTEDIYVRLLVMYTEIDMFDEVISIVGYTQGSEISLEITLNMIEDVDLEEVNDCIIKIEQDFEYCEGIERCYVNCENDVPVSSPTLDAVSTVGRSTLEVPLTHVPEVVEIPSERNTIITKSVMEDIEKIEEG